MEDPADETKNLTDVPPHQFWFDLNFLFTYCDCAPVVLFY